MRSAGAETRDLPVPEDDPLGTQDRRELPVHSMESLLANLGRVAMGCMVLSRELNREMTPLPNAPPQLMGADAQKNTFKMSAAAIHATAQCNRAFP